MREFAIGVDLGGTNLRAAAITPEGAVLEEFSIATGAGGGREGVVDNIVAGIEEVREGHQGKDLIGIGIGVPGLIDLKKGLIVKAPNLPGWEDFPLKGILEERLSCPVILENDANAAALGEVWRGAGIDVDDLVLLTLGTGIGGGIISGGEIIHGYLGMAGEVGHITVEPDSRVQCGCGNYGCLETEASATAIVRRAREALDAGEAPVLQKLLGNGRELDARVVSDAAEAGDEACREIYALMGTALGRGLANLVNIFNFPLYLMGGGVVAGWDLFASAMFAEVEKRSVTYRNSGTRVEQAKLGNKAGLFGSAHLPMRHASV